MERKSKKERVYIYIYLIYFAVQQKLTKHCKPTMLPKKFFFKKEKKVHLLHKALPILSSPLVYAVHIYTHF